VENGKPTNKFAKPDCDTQKGLFNSLYNAYQQPILLFDEYASLSAMNRAAQRFFPENTPQDTNLYALIPHCDRTALSKELDSIAPEPLEINLETFGLSGKLQRLVMPGLPLDKHLLLTVQTRPHNHSVRPSSFDFLSRVATELKTPLNAIIGFSSIMDLTSDRITQAEIKDFAGEIYRSGNHILSVVRYISDLSQIESGQMNLQIRTLDCHQILDTCLNELQPMMEKRNIGIIRAYQQSNLVNADEQRLKQVLISLLSNAIKYNRQNGRITIRCNPKPNGEFVISISDTGKGLKPQQINHLFEPFNRFDAYSEGVEGAGIGLITTRHLLEKMGGRIWAESQINKGSTFSISLPCPSKTPPTLHPKAKR